MIRLLDKISFLAYILNIYLVYRHALILNENMKNNSNKKSEVKYEDRDMKEKYAHDYYGCDIYMYASLIDFLILHRHTYVYMCVCF